MVASVSGTVSSGNVTHPTHTPQTTLVSYVRAENFLGPATHREAQRIYAARKQHGSLIQRCGFRTTLLLSPCLQSHSLWPCSLLIYDFAENKSSIFRCTHCAADPDAEPGDGMQLPFLSEARQTMNQWKRYSKGLQEKLAQSGYCRTRAQDTMYGLLECKLVAGKFHNGLGCTIGELSAFGATSCTIHLCRSNGCDRKRSVLSSRRSRVDGARPAAANVTFKDVAAYQHQQVCAFAFSMWLPAVQVGVRRFSSTVFRTLATSNMLLSVWFVFLLPESDTTGLNRKTTDSTCPRLLSGHVIALGTT